MSKFIEIKAGARFGAWTVLGVGEPSPQKYREPLPRMLCRCDCGREKLVIKSSLTSGRSTGCQQCGRLKAKNRKLKFIRSKSPMYPTWYAIMQRCYNPNHVAFKNYGGRGIAVCDRWLSENGVINFLVDMGPRPSPEHTVDRIDNDGDYSPDNCRWATPFEQQHNRRVSVVPKVGMLALELRSYASARGIRNSCRMKSEQVIFELRSLGLLPR